MVSLALLQKDIRIFMDKLDYWRLCDELGLVQAACLIVGVDPSDEIGSFCADWQIHEQPFGFHAALTAITHALRRGAIKGKITHEKLFDINGNPYDEIKDSIIIKESTVEVESLRAWLESRGINSGFFFPEIVSSTPNYLNPKDVRYAPKLAAAVTAWQSVTDPGKQTPKQALTKWVRENAAKFGLTDSEGKQNETGIEEVAKVANWNDRGGAPTTPGK